MTPGTSRRRALLLDRDGVINIDHGYVGTRARFEFTGGIFELTRRAYDRGYSPVVITNQSGIGRNYYSEADFITLCCWMKNEFTRQGTPLAGIFHCPYLGDAPNSAYRRDSYWRKPNPGMILEAAILLNLNLAASIFVGDQPTDMTAAAAAGVGCRVLIGQNRTDSQATLTVARLEEIAFGTQGIAPNSPTTENL